MALEQPHRLKLPSPDARVARSPFQGATDLFSEGGAAAFSSLDFTGLALNTETVVIDGVTYTFQTVLTDVDGNVLIGATAEECRDNLIDAINVGPGRGTRYANSMTEHPTVRAEESGGQLDAIMKNVGTFGNATAVTETLTNGSWDNNPMEDGADPDDEVRFVPIVQWSQMRIRVRLTGGSGVLGVNFARPNRALDPALLPGAAEAFVYTVDVPAIDGTVLVDGVEQALEISAAEHQGENWLRVTLGSFTNGGALDFLDISGELLGTYH